MQPARHFNDLPLPLIVLMAIYFMTSIGHFGHNAEFICEYPNLPVWLTRAKVYAVWLAITSVGATGLLLMRKRFDAAGLSFIAIYAALGFDGLEHYAIAPMEWHSLSANLTILSEVVAAALLLSFVLRSLILQLSDGGKRHEQ
jgi:hypothetical protein